jgi:hypothetical protein
MSCVSAGPRTYEVDTLAEVINRALQSKHTVVSTHWNARPLAAYFRPLSNL